PGLKSAHHLQSKYGAQHQCISAGFQCCHGLRIALSSGLDNALVRPGRRDQTLHRGQGLRAIGVEKLVFLSLQIPESLLHDVMPFRKGWLHVRGLCSAVDGESTNEKETEDVDKTSAHHVVPADPRSLHLFSSQNNSYEAEWTSTCRRR